MAVASCPAGLVLARPVFRAVCTMDVHTRWPHMCLGTYTGGRGTSGTEAVAKCTVITCLAGEQPIARGVVIVNGARSHPSLD